jgi:hypothetical protein
MIKELEAFEPYLISANVRNRFSPEGLLVEEGVGQVGDLVLGEVRPAPDRPITVFDQNLAAHRIASPTRVLAILGTRLSTTHVNAGIPPGGLDVLSGSEARWIAGESGLVGLLFHEADPDTPFQAETSVAFRCDGLVVQRSGAPVNVRSLAVRPESTDLATPLLLISATAAETGKTVLTGKVIRQLVNSGRRVAAVKVTGTGGTMDSQRHREAGAFPAADQVDGGLITTYCPAETFRERIILPFLYAQDHEPDLIVGELGGDLTFANNPTFLRMPEVRRNLGGMMVISSDPLSCYGVARYLTEALEIGPELVRHFTSPFRNPWGMKARASVMGVEEVYDPNSSEDIERALDAFALGTWLAPRPGSDENASW